MRDGRAVALFNDHRLSAPAGHIGNIPATEVPRLAGQVGSENKLSPVAFIPPVKFPVRSPGNARQTLAACIDDPRYLEAWRLVLELRIG